jgi:division protein CdvB (Snf7/Vps24/ESCRT-III family)
LKKLEEGQEQLKADQFALEQQKANLGQIKKDAMAYRNLKEQVIVVLTLLKKVPEIMKNVMTKTNLGNAISKLAEMVGLNISGPKIES